MMKFLRYTLAIVFAIVANFSLKAAEPYKVLTFPDDNKANNKCSSYTQTWEAKIGSNTWTIKGFNNNSWNNDWTYIKCGQKNTASAATISSTESNEVGAIVITIDKVNTSANPKVKVKCINSMGTAQTPGMSITKEGDMLVTVPNATVIELSISTDAVTSNGAVQISKIAYYKVGEEPEQDYQQAESLEDLYAKFPQRTNFVEVNFTNAKVLYAAVINGIRTAYIREGEKTVQISSFAKGTIKTNGILNGKMKFKRFIPASGILNADGAACEILTESTKPAQPREATIDEIRNEGKFKNDLVVVRNFVLYAPAGSSRWAGDTYQSKNRLQIRGDYGVDDLSELTDGETYSAEGIIDGYSGNDPLLHLTKKVKETTTGISDITIDEVIKDAPTYNLAGQKVGKDYKGVVIKAGKKMIQK